MAMGCATFFLDAIVMKRSLIITILVKTKSFDLAELGTHFSY